MVKLQLRYTAVFQMNGLIVFIQIYLKRLFRGHNIDRVSFILNRDELLYLNLSNAAGCIIGSKFVQLLEQNTDADKAFDSLMKALGE